MIFINTRSWDHALLMLKTFGSSLSLSGQSPFPSVFFNVVPDPLFCHSSLRFQLSLSVSLSLSTPTTPQAVKVQILLHDPLSLPSSGLSLTPSYSPSKWS